MSCMTHVCQPQKAKFFAAISEDDSDMENRSGPVRSRDASLKKEETDSDAPRTKRSSTSFKNETNGSEADEPEAGEDDEDEEGDEEEDEEVYEFRTPNLCYRTLLRFATATSSKRFGNIWWTKM